MSSATPLASAISVFVADRASSALLLDIDGTLAPIVRDPQSASVSEITRRLLIECNELFGLVGCISGRQAKEARRIVGIGSLPYSGNHGLELLPRGASIAQQLGELFVGGPQTAGRSERDEQNVD